MPAPFESNMRSTGAFAGKGSFKCASVATVSQLWAPDDHSRVASGQVGGWERREREEVVPWPNSERDHDRVSSHDEYADIELMEASIAAEIGQDAS